MRSLPSLGRAFGVAGFIHPDQRVFSLQISVCREVAIRNWGEGGILWCLSFLFFVLELSQELNVVIISKYQPLVDL